MSTANIYYSCGYSVLLIPKEDSTQDFLVLALPQPLTRFHKIMHSLWKYCYWETAKEFQISLSVKLHKTWSSWAINSNTALIWTSLFISLTQPYKLTCCNILTICFHLVSVMAGPQSISEWQKYLPMGFVYQDCLVFFLKILFCGYIKSKIWENSNFSQSCPSSCGRLKYVLLKSGRSLFLTNISVNWSLKKRL